MNKNTSELYSNVQKDMVILYAEMNNRKDWEY